MGKIQDERIIAGKRRINSSAFGICFMALWAILLYRQVWLKQDIRQYADIFLLTIGISLYMLINNILQGYYLTYRKPAEKKKVFIIGAVVGTVVFSISQIVVLKYRFADSKDMLKLVTQAAVFLAAWVGTQFLLFRISEKQADKGAEDDE